jgi:hypothetical protein
MIRLGENPEGYKGVNKFLSPEGEGVRGVIIALHVDRKQAIVLALNSTFDGSIEWGKLYLVKEKNPDEYPRVIRQVDSVPNVKSWKVTLLNQVAFKC